MSAHHTWPVTLYETVMDLERLTRIPHDPINVVFEQELFWLDQIGLFVFINKRFLDANCELDGAFLD